MLRSGDCKRPDPQALTAIAKPLRSDVASVRGQDPKARFTALLQTTASCLASNIMRVTVERHGWDRLTSIFVHWPTLRFNLEILPMRFVDQLKAAGRSVSAKFTKSSGTADDPMVLVDKGIALEEAGQPNEALQCYERALCLKPDLARAHLCRGNILLESQDVEGAIHAYSTAISYSPGYAAAHYNLGNLYFRIDRRDEALKAYRMAISLKPDFPDAEVALGVALEEAGMMDEAISRYRRALEIKPDYFEVCMNMGNALKSLGRIEDAVTHYRRAITINPDFVPAYFQLGDTLGELGQDADAMAIYRQLIGIRPGLVEAHNNLGNLLKHCGRIDEAIASYETALRFAPDSADVLNNLGTVFEEIGRLDEAVAHYRRALHLAPTAANVHNNLGNALQAMGRYHEALAQYQQALEIGPDLADIHGNIGSTLHRLGQFHGAIQSYRRALAMDPHHAGVYNNLGTTLKDLEEFSEALQCFRTALEIDPAYSIAFDNLLFVLNYDPDKSAQEIYESYQEYERRFGEPFQTEWMPHGNKRILQRRLRVGYVSPDFKGHACAFFVEPLLANHDKAIVDVYAYADLVKEDAVTERLKGYVEHWVPTLGMSDAALARRIRDDEIDVLIDLAGHTSGNRLSVFARKPAPVSLSWMGYGYTTGLRAIDYFLTDEVSAPPGSELLFSEKPWRLKDACFAVYRPGEGMGEVSTLPALERGYITLGTLTRSVRINHRTVRVWAALLKRLPTARLVIDSASFRDAAIQEALLQRFEAQGVGRDRLMVGCHSPPWNVLRGVDIGLDCFPHNSGTTLYESLYMGVPYITLAGRPSVGRIGSSILRGLGNPEWIACSEEEYIEKVVSLATDLPALAKLRGELRPRMQASALMDEGGFARRVEHAYEQMFQNWVLSRQ